MLDLTVDVHWVSQELHELQLSLEARYCVLLHSLCLHLHLIRLHVLAGFKCRGISEAMDLRFLGAVLVVVGIALAPASHAADTVQCDMQASWRATSLLQEARSVGLQAHACIISTVSVDVVTESRWGCCSEFMNKQGSEFFWKFVDQLSSSTFASSTLQGPNLINTEIKSIFSFCQLSNICFRTIRSEHACS